MPISFSNGIHSTTISSLSIDPIARNTTYAVGVTSLTQHSSSHMARLCYVESVSAPLDSYNNGNLNMLLHFGRIGNNSFSLIPRNVRCNGFRRQRKSYTLQQDPDTLEGSLPRNRSPLSQGWLVIFGDVAPTYSRERENVTDF